MQGHPFAIPVRASVLGVTDDRPPLVGQMHANLVLSPRNQTDFQQRSITASLHHLVMRAGKLAPLGIVCGIHAQRVIFDQVGGDFALRGIRMALDEGKIGLLHVRPVVLQRSFGLFRAGENQHPGGVPIKTMNDKNTFTRLWVPLFDVVRKRRVCGSLAILTGPNR